MNALTIHQIEGEPRIHDLDLGSRLGFAQPRDIRKLIKRNEDKLLKFGGCATVARRVEGNETTEFYLNQKQSIFICMKSETDQAFEVQADIVRVYDAHQNGGVVSLPQSFADALQLAADQQRRIEQQQREIEASRPKALFHDQVVSTETLLDRAQVFSLLQRKTGQSFTPRTWLVFLRRHGIACQPNRHANIGADRFVPRKDYIGTWFVSELSATGVVEWFIRPIAIAGIVSLIEQDRMNSPVPINGYLPHQNGNNA